MCYNITMTKIGNFISNNPSLCISTAGLAILGYLGYRAICWMINLTTQSTFKADQLAKRVISPKKVEINASEKGTIDEGQGEYIAYYTNPSKSLTQESYNQIHDICEAHKTTENRKVAIENAVKEIDPHLHIAFIPKTLYELIYLHQCIEEDIQEGALCPLLRYSHTHEKAATKDCWHINNSQTPDDINKARLKRVALRLNDTIASTLHPSKDGMTYKAICEHTTKELTYFKNHHQTFYISTSELPHCTAGPTVRFANPKLDSMAIATPSDENIVMSAVALDCSKHAQNAFIFYRGANYNLDKVKSKDSEPYSLSYGSSLFAGASYDADAAAFTHMKSSDHAYAVVVPFDQIDRSPFSRPSSTNTLHQLSSSGETFHVRTRAWKNHNYYSHNIPGVWINTSLASDRAIADTKKLLSNISKKELIHSFNHYKKAALILKAP